MVRISVLAAPRNVDVSIAVCSGAVELEVQVDRTCWRPRDTHARVAGTRYCPETDSPVTAKRARSALLFGIDVAYRRRQFIHLPCSPPANESSCTRRA